MTCGPVDVLFGSRRSWVLMISQRADGFLHRDSRTLVCASIFPEAAISCSLGSGFRPVPPSFFPAPVSFASQRALAFGAALGQRFVEGIACFLIRANERKLIGPLFSGEKRSSFFE
ncbi:hypothetical protein MRX96_014634 [Rhipicephalus microplus]